VERAGPESAWRIEVVAEPGELFSHLTAETHMLLLDERSAPGGYMSAIKRARRTVPAVDVIVVGGPKSDELIAGERRDGVDEYHQRPIDSDMLASSLGHRMQLAALKTRAGIVGRSPGVVELLEAVLQVAPTEVPILILGESGTGKDVVARAIHMASLRSNRPFEAINCGAVAEGVLESELFGHEKGAFTGAVSRRAGMFERADGGTIFLDEVGETSATMQVRLLRVLESGDVMRVGGVQGFQVDVRVIAATNRRLADAVATGTFRQDLYYRLKGITLYLPPLRERPEDLPILAQHFVAASNRQHHKSIRGLEPSALSRLAEHDWPGNIRELRNLIDTLVVLSPGPRITRAQVDAQLSREGGAGLRPEEPSMLPVPLNRSREEAEREMLYASIMAMHRDIREILALLQSGTRTQPWEGLREVRTDDAVDEEAMLNLAQLERSAIHEALGRHNGNRRRAAEELGISERTLYRKIKEYGLV
jgi:DNA-binding NtrC family response regulator